MAKKISKKKARKLAKAVLKSNKPGKKVKKMAKSVLGKKK